MTKKTKWTSLLLVLSIIFLVTAGLVVVGVWYRLEKVESGSWASAHERGIAASGVAESG